MDENDSPYTPVNLVVGFGLFIFLVVVVLFSAGIFTDIYQGATGKTNSFSQTILSDNGSLQVLTGTPEGVVTLAVKNRTWINLDGISNVLNFTNTHQTISFWYKNSTNLFWKNVINSSGITYVNGSLDTPELYPVYYDGASFLVGQTDATTFVEVQIDEIRFYNGDINDTIAEEIFDYGR